MKWLIGFITLAVFSLGTWLWLKPQAVAPIALETKTINLGQVEISTTPKNVEAGKALVFDLTFTTHSVELDYDLTQVVSAKDDRDNSYQVISWSGGSGGHHLQGSLAFDPLQSGAQELKLIFTGIDNQSGELNWKLERR